MKTRSPLKRWFFTGLILLVPLMVTFYIFMSVVSSMDNLIRLIPYA